ncbi:MAG TPA: hypothetical protein VKQ29_11280 [Aliidongia sp.]|nr:hypothetical protein [Aliidongia sp.]
MQTTEIIATGNGVTIVTPKATDTVSLDEVRAIVAYKIDEITTDLICCDITTGPEERPKILTIHEEIPGFDAVMTLFEALPDFNPQWRNAVLLEPFAENRTTLYRRHRTV